MLKTGIDSAHVAILLLVLAVLSGSCSTGRLDAACADRDAALAAINRLATSDWQTIHESDAYQWWPNPGLTRQTVTSTGHCDAIALVCGAPANGTCLACEALTFAAVTQRSTDSCNRTLETLAFSRTLDTYADAVDLANKIIFAASGDTSKLLRTTSTHDQGPVSVSWQPRSIGAPRSLEISFAPHRDKWTVYVHLG
jgi:hypothetical protein